MSKLFLKEILINHTIKLINNLLFIKYVYNEFATTSTRKETEINTLDKNLSHSREPVFCFEFCFSGQKKS